MSLTNDFPSLPTTPQVNLPREQAHPRRSSNILQPVATNNNLEGHLRDMILSNGVPNRPVPIHYGRGSNQRAPGRQNQAQRRQQAIQSNGNVSSNPLAIEQISNRGFTAPEPTQNVQYQPPHLRGLPNQPGQVRNNHPSQGNQDFSSQHQSRRYQTAINSPPNQAFPVGNQPYNRPPPIDRRLYNPGSYDTQPPQAGRSMNLTSRPSLGSQVAYLESLAHVEIFKAEINSEELLEKQALQQSLEQVCRKAVSEYEMHRGRNAAFVSDSVELRCFGSLSTTFATKSSDMDLVLVSPMSKPETSSPDSELPRLIEKALLDLGYGARLLTRTRVPIIRFCEKPTPELATLLLAERTKYEKERDTPPPEPKVEKTPKRTEKPASTTRNQSNVAVSKGVVAVEGLNNAKSEDDQGHDARDSASSPGVLQSDTPVDGEGHAKETKDGRESDDPSLADKSDGERVRLYKLAMQDGWYEPMERRTINHFISTSERYGVPGSEHTQPNELQPQPSDRPNMKLDDDGHLEKARAALQDLPNVLARYRPPPAAHPLDFPKQGVGIQCDINFSNHLALQNSHLLKCYASCDPRVRKMVLFVKAWSKKRKINSPYHGTLSSYGYVLMVLHYLVNVANPPVAPNLQISPLMLQDELSTKEVSLEKYNIQFFRNERKILDLAHQGQLTFNQEPLGSLLRGFFHYFAQQGYGSPSGGFAWTQDALSLRTIGGIIPKQAKGWTGAKTETVDLSGPGPQKKEIRQRYLFAIEDPFEIDHNIARTVVHHGIIAIRDEFRRAHRLIQNAGNALGKGPEDLFAEAEEKENLQYRPFGPRPRRDVGPGQNGGKNGTGPVSGHEERPTTVNTGK